MSELNRSLNEYLGFKKATPTPADFLEAIAQAKRDKQGKLSQELTARMGDGESIETLEAMIRRMASLDLPVSSNALERDPAARLKRVAHIAREITGSDHKEVPHFSEAQLHNAPPDVRLKYKEMLGELYEVGAMFRLIGEELHKTDYVKHSVKFWREYLAYAKGHREEQKRISIAQRYVQDM